MAKGLGIAAIIVAILGAFIPVFGFFIGLAALFFAAVAALAGERVFSIATVAVSTIVFVFLTPSLWVSAIGESVETEGANALGIVAIVALCLPVLAIILNATGKLVIGIGKRSSYRTGEE